MSEAHVRVCSDIQEVLPILLGARLREGYRPNPSQPNQTKPGNDTLLDLPCGQPRERETNRLRASGLSARAVDAWQLRSNPVASPTRARRARHIRHRICEMGTLSTQHPAPRNLETAEPRIQNQTPAYRLLDLQHSRFEFGKAGVAGNRVERHAESFAGLVGFDDAIHPQTCRRIPRIQLFAVAGLNFFQ